MSCVTTSGPGRMRYRRIYYLPVAWEAHRELLSSRGGVFGLHSPREQRTLYTPLARFFTSQTLGRFTNLQTSRLFLPR